MRRACGCPCAVVGGASARPGRSWWGWSGGRSRSGPLRSDGILRSSGSGRAWPLPVPALSARGPGGPGGGPRIVGRGQRAAPDGKIWMRPDAPGGRLEIYG